MSTTLPPGTILGNRFAIVGALGSGGTATVYLVVDQLRGERIALKVVHPHLASDPATQRRLRREVSAATLVAHDAALVPYDLHELEGHLALSMPYHPGQTLSEVVGAEGPLAPDKVRTLGIRVAEALATAHRSGLLHRDVTGNNILLESGDQAVLTDFGLSRVQSQATNSTGMLGTAGYAAPEVYSGERSDPRADLYGLGCALYLAATGETPFGTDTPMAALKRQLAESYTPIQQRNPAVPDDLARTIEALLRKEPADRPQGAREVADALRAGVPAGEELNSPVTAGGSEVASSGRKAHLKPGNWAVLVREHDEDRARRRQLRVDAKKERKTLETEVSRRARELMNGVLAYVGLHSEDDPSPEDLLVQAVVDEARLPEEAKLAVPPAVLRKRFLLVDGVSEATAKRLQREVRTAGFKARIGDTTPPDQGRLSGLFTAMMVSGWVLTAFVGAYIDIRLWIAMMVGVTILVSRYNQTRPQLKVGDLPVAYGPDLTRWLDRPVAGTHVIDASAKAASAGAPASRDSEDDREDSDDDTPLTRGQQLAQRVLRQLDALQKTIEDLDLPTIAANDLRDTARDLEERAIDLSDAIDRLDSELEAGAADGSWIEPRLARLRTKQRAGETVDPAEIRRLESALASHQASEALLAQLDSQLTQATAELLEIASTATRVRRELLAEPEPTQTATRALDRLREEAAHADAARRELAKRAAQRTARR